MFRRLTTWLKTVAGRGTSNDRHRAFGQPPPARPEIDRVRVLHYAHIGKENPDSYSVDDTTASDLDLDNVFARVDRTISGVGARSAAARECRAFARYDSLGFPEEILSKAIAQTRKLREARGFGSQDDETTLKDPRGKPPAT